MGSRSVSNRGRLVAFGAIAIAALSLLACQSGALEERVSAVEQKAGRVSIPSGERTFYLTGVEWKGSTSTKDLAAPTSDPKKLSDGYRYKGPGVADASDATKWEVSTYVWHPGALMATEGDKINLVTFIINGDKHTFHVMGPDGQDLDVNADGRTLKEVLMNRGREYKVTFTASKPGVYTIHCDEHDPTMTSLLLVLPRG